MRLMTAALAIGTLAVAPPALSGDGPLSSIPNAAPDPAADGDTSTLRLDSRFAPRIDRTDRGVSVRYELWLSNRGTEPVELRSLTVRIANGRRPTLDIAGAGLGAIVSRGRP